MPIRPFDRDALKRRFDEAVPFRHVVIDGFLEPDFAREVARAYPNFEQAVEQGFTFNFVNERKKVQVSDASRFPSPVARLNDALASSAFLADLEHITGIPGLLADKALLGGGMHITGPHGRLDVHLDFNYSEENEWFRRLNILIYLNEEWNDDWGGEVEFWDRDVKVCHHALAPVLNRCVLFETSNISFHGVRPLVCPPDRVRKSFAAYYYTKEPTRDWNGETFSTVFKARPDEWLRGRVLAPAEGAFRKTRDRLRTWRRGLLRGSKG